MGERERPQRGRILRETVNTMRRDFEGALDFFDRVVDVFDALSGHGTGRGRPAPQELPPQPPPIRTKVDAKVVRQKDGSVEVVVQAPPPPRRLPPQR